MSLGMWMVMPAPIGQIEISENPKEPNCPNPAPVFPTDMSDLVTGMRVVYVNVVFCVGVYLDSFLVLKPDINTQQSSYTLQTYSQPNN